VITEKKEEINLVRHISDEKQPLAISKINEQGSMLTHESIDFSSATERKIENQLTEMFQNVSDFESLKFEEEIKEEMEIDNDKFFKTSTQSNKTSPYSKTYNYKSKFDKVLISPINRPMNIVKIKTKGIHKKLCD